MKSTRCKTTPCTRGQYGWIQRNRRCGPASPAAAAIRPRRDYNTCYPPAVNYSPRYYLINGVAFDKTQSFRFAVPLKPGDRTCAGGETVLVRMVNAGLRMHVPSIVGAQTGAALRLPGFCADRGGRQRAAGRSDVAQSEVFMAPGKTYDVMINVPVRGRGTPRLSRSSIAPVGPCRVTRQHAMPA